MNFIKELARRNPIFFYQGIGLTLLFIFFLKTFRECQFSSHEFCFWLKPFKFALSFAIYVLTLGWYMEYLKNKIGKKMISIMSWSIFSLISIELALILISSLLQSNSPYFSQFTDQQLASWSKTLYFLSNGVIITNTLMAIYVGAQFFHNLPLKPLSYLWGIRAGFIIFILSGLVGAFMIGKYGQIPPDPNDYGIPLTRFSSLRDYLLSLHFLGTHSLQILPLICYYFSKYISRNFVVSSIAVYMLAFIVLMVSSSS